MQKSGLKFLNLFGLTLLLVSCGGENTSRPDYNPDIGPFDKDGNYIEAWADNPPSKRARKKRASVKTKPSQQEIAKVAQKTEIKSEPKIQTALQPKPQVTPKPRTTPKAKPTPKTIPKPKPKAKPKAKPRPIKVTPKILKHRVQKSDTLYSLARRYGSTVSKIKQANGLKSSTILTGSLLIIPR